jgi:hypothetical protein
LKFESLWVRDTSKRRNAEGKDRKKEEKKKEKWPQKGQSS